MFKYLHYAADRFLLCVSVLTLVAIADCPRVHAVNLFVSPSGRDNNPGTKEKPIATLAGARDALRQIRQAGPLHEAVTVSFAAGEYFLPGPVEFNQRDSGLTAAPITYQAEPGAVVRLTGGREVTGWQPVTDAAVLDLWPAQARRHARVADLRAQGITELGLMRVRGFGAGGGVAEAELFFKDESMTLARWPNTGFRGAESKENDQTVIVDSDRVGRWVGETDPWVFAYWYHDWAELYEPLAGVDPVKHALLRGPDVKPTYGIAPERVRWYGLNLLSELDRPGEYYIDRDHGRVYFWPPAKDGRVVLSVADELIRAEDLSHVTFRGFTFEACRGTAITFKGGRHAAVVGCVVRNVGQRGVGVVGGKHHTIYGCDIYQTGEGGISMSGGDRPTLTPAGHNAENNHVHHYSRRARTYRPGISVSGVGNRIAHNRIHDGPHMALSAGGNDHVVEFNEIHNVVEDSGDAGAYYVGRDWTQRGNQLRWNYWHDIAGGTGYGGMTIYLDDQHCGHGIYGNLFVRCMQPVFIGGGDDNVVTKNVFLDCWKSAHLDNRGMGWQKAATDDPNDTLRTRLRAMPYTNALWRSRYPQLVNILEDDPGIPKRNVFAGNISAGGRFDDITPSVRRFQVVTNNLVYDEDKQWVRLARDAGGQPMTVEYKDPGAVVGIGFEALPVEKMGLYEDPRRASWPVPRTTRPVVLPQD